MIGLFSPTVAGLWFSPASVSLSLCRLLVFRVICIDTGPLVGIAAEIADTLAEVFRLQHKGVAGPSVAVQSSIQGAEIGVPNLDVGCRDAGAIIIHHHLQLLTPASDWLAQ